MFILHSRKIITKLIWSRKQISFCYFKHTSQLHFGIKPRSPKTQLKHWRRKTILPRVRFHQTLNVETKYYLFTRRYLLTIKFELYCVIKSWYVLPFCVTFRRCLATRIRFGNSARPAKYFATGIYWMRQHNGQIFRLISPQRKTGKMHVVL